MVRLTKLSYVIHPFYSAPNYLKEARLPEYAKLHMSEFYSKGLIQLYMHRINQVRDEGEGSVLLFSRNSQSKEGKAMQDELFNHASSVLTPGLNLFETAESGFLEVPWTLNVNLDESRRYEENKPLLAALSEAGYVISDKLDIEGFGEYACHCVARLLDKIERDFNTLQPSRSVPIIAVGNNTPNPLPRSNTFVSVVRNLLKLETKPNPVSINKPAGDLPPVHEDTNGFFHERCNRLVQSETPVAIHVWRNEALCGDNVRIVVGANPELFREHYNDIMAHAP